MIFPIFKNFLEFIFIFKPFKKISKKGVFYRAGPAQMQRGTQGHVAEPREPTRAPTWRGGDTCARYIFLYYYIVI